MVTVCIFELRNAMRTVQKAFNISSQSTTHTIPDMAKEIEILTEALQEYNIQVYIIDRASNEALNSSRDLLGEGSKYPNSWGGFCTSRPDPRTPVNLGFVEPTIGDGASTGGRVEEEESTQEVYEVSREDLAMDDEEPYDALDISIGDLMDAS